MTSKESKEKLSQSQKIRLALKIVEDLEASNETDHDTESKISLKTIDSSKTLPKQEKEDEEESSSRTVWQTAKMCFCCGLAILIVYGALAMIIAFDANSEGKV